MKRQYRKVLISLMMLFCIINAVGCGGTMVQNTPEDSFYERSAVDESELGTNEMSNLDKIYNDAFDRFTDPDAAEEMEGTDIFDKVSRKLISGYYRTYRVFRSMSPIIIACSIAIGVLMMVLSRQNKKLKRAGLMIFIIGVPIAVIVAVFGIGILNGVLLY